MKYLLTRFLTWLRPAPVIEVRYVVDPQMGKRQLEQIQKHVNRTKYRLGDTIETVAYRQGQADLAHFIESQLFGGKL